MMAEDEMNDDVMFRESGETKEVFRPAAYHVWPSSEDDSSTTDDPETYANELPNSGQISKPLMPPRQRPPIMSIQFAQRPKRTLCQRIFWPSVYMFIFCASMASFVCLVMYIVDVYTNKLMLAEQEEIRKINARRRNLTTVGCSSLSVEDVWLVGLPKLLTESAFRLVDANQDGVLDIIMGFATGADKLRQDPLVCDIYFNGTRPCGGGILALDGITGNKLWEHRASHEIFALNCAEDLNKDGIKDCIGGGRAGTFQAASGRDGSLLWKFNDSSLNVVMNAYTGQYVGDLDGDNVPDILNIHGGDPLGEPGSETRLVGKIVLFSGRTGKVIRWSDVPENRESYYSPVVYRRKDGTDYVLFGTGGETHPGALWLITLWDLEKGEINKAIKLYNDAFKGIMTPPLLLDLNKDGTEDIIFATFNSTIVALDGENHKMLWNFSYASSETYATPAAGFYDDDDVPDFIIRWQTGPGFPLYYHSIMTVLDGTNGKPLITPYPRDSVGAQTSPLTLSVEGTGNDIFLYWISDCHGTEGKEAKFSFMKGTNVHEKSRADFCRLRFKESGFSKMLAVGGRIPSPGQAVYNSEERYHIERQAWVNTTALAQEFLHTHPDKQRDHELWQAWVKAQQNKWRRKDRLRRPRPRIGNNDYENNHGRLDYLGNKDIDTLTDNDLRQKITSIVSELLSQKDGIENSDSPNGDETYMGGQPMGLKADVKKRLLQTPYNRGDFDIVNALDDKEGEDSDLEPAAVEALDGRGLSWDGGGEGLAKVNFMPAPYTSPMGRVPHGAIGPEQRKSGRGVEESERERRLQKLHQKYMESFGRRKRRLGEQTKKMQKRHVGPHDEGGLQRLISTGALVPPLLKPSHPDYAHSMDVVFATYWFYPAKTKILLPEDEECVKRKMENERVRFNPESHYYGMDHDAFEHATLDECLEESGHMPESGTFESQSTYNPYNVHMGQMTVYRLRLKCECGGSEAHLRAHGKRCARFLPHDQQQWAAYMGSLGNSHWLPRTNDDSKDASRLSKHR